MTMIPSLQAIAAALLAFGLSAAPAQAGPNRTFVSGKGTDAGACTRALPCRSFAFAFTRTAAGGEIDVLDQASYGPMLITNAISVVNDGVGVAAIEVAVGNGITINAGASDSVRLRGLTIEGLGSGSDGIAFGSGGNLEIENCVIRNFRNSGIEIAPITSSSFSVSNTIASNNSNNGIVVGPDGSAVVKGVLSNVTANNNSTGISVGGTLSTAAFLDVTVVDSEFSNNSNVGVGVNSAGGAAATAVMLRNTVAMYNGTGLFAQNAILRVGHSVITGNGFGVGTALGGTLTSYGDNDINGNTNNNTGVLDRILTH
ncbi:MAG: right-handed parallel beta-helix repeat-containing protein [Gammaproteobacteria bacterium]